MGGGLQIIKDKNLKRSTNLTSFVHVEVRDKWALHVWLWGRQNNKRHTRTNQCISAFFLGIGRVPTVSPPCSSFFKKKKWLGHTCSHVQCVVGVPYLSDAGTLAQIPCPCFVEKIKQRLRSSKYLCTQWQLRRTSTTPYS